MLFPLVPEATTAEDRVHLDAEVGADDVDAVVARFVDRGATVLHQGRQGPQTWTTMQDPEGDESCVSR